MNCLFLPARFGRELSAGGADILPLRPSDGSVQMPTEQVILPPGNRIPLRRRKTKPSICVIGNQINFRRDAAQEFRQSFQVGGAIIYSFEHDVFDGNTLAALERILTKRLKEVIKRPLSIDRNQAVADLVSGGVKRDCQIRPCPA